MPNFASKNLDRALQRASYQLPVRDAVHTRASVADRGGELLAKDIMSAPVISVEPDAPVVEVADLLASHRISGVPVIRDGKPVGVVNEMHLVHRHEIGTERAPPRPWWARLFHGDHAPSRYVKSHALRAKDIMTSPVTSITEDTTLPQIAALFDSRAVRRLPVVRAGNVVGIITRANLVQALAANASSARTEPSKSDEEIRQALVAELERQPWWHPGWSTVSVTDGVVQFRGVIDTQDEKHAARVAAENVSGVRKVEDLRRRYVDQPGT